MLAGVVFHAFEVAFRRAGLEGGRAGARQAGQVQPGDVFRVGMPRTDLSVTVKGVPVKAGFALGSYAAFKQMGQQAMVMGDLVLLDQEIRPSCRGSSAGARGHRRPQPSERDLATRHVHALRGPRGCGGAGPGASPGPVGQRDPARRPRPPPGRRRRARDAADRAGARPDRARHRRRRLPGHGAARGGHHRDGACRCCPPWA